MSQVKGGYRYVGCTTASHLDVKEREVRILSKQRRGSTGEKNVLFCGGVWLTLSIGVRTEEREVSR